LISARGPGVRRIQVDFPEGTATSVLRHRVAFHETDAMGVMHHANYIKLFEEARVLFLQEHDRPYTEYINVGRQFVVTRVDAEYLIPARFDDPLEVEIAAQWIAGASAGFIYQVRRASDLLVRGVTEHALIDERGTPRRIPADWRRHLLSLAIQKTPG
jgi:acyl-CoA thioester hydrolase